MHAAEDLKIPNLLSLPESASHGSEPGEQGRRRVMGSPGSLISDHTREHRSASPHVKSTLESVNKKQCRADGDAGGRTEVGGT
jgi:hypothetical protein